MTMYLKPLLWTAPQVAELLCVPTRRVYALTRAGLLPHVRLGSRQIRFDERAVREWIDGGGSAGDRSQEAGERLGAEPKPSL